jgi:transposase, IS5 family
MARRRIGQEDLIAPAEPRAALPLLATDEGAALIRGLEVTTANIHDAAELEAVLPPEAGNVYADSAFNGDKPWKAIRARGGMP